MGSVLGRVSEAKFLFTVVEGVDAAFCCGEAWEKVFSLSSDGGSVSAIDEAFLGALKLGKNSAGTLQDKKAKHLCYMFELFAAICIEPSQNITMNPGCEWQLQLYTKNAN